jgi:hypothetical protein
MKPEGPHKLTFLVTDADTEDDTIAVRDMMLPKPGLSGSAATTTATSAASSSSSTPAPPTTAEGLLKQAQASLDALNNPPAAGVTAGAGSSSSKAAASTGANPGPKPPTLSIRNAGINDLGTTAISLKSYEKKYGKTGETLHIFELIPQKPVIPAGTGVAPAKSPDKPSGAGEAAASSAAEAAASQSAAAGAGT